MDGAFCNDDAVTLPVRDERHPMRPETDQARQFAKLPTHFDADVPAFDVQASVLDDDDAVQAVKPRGFVADYARVIGVDFVQILRRERDGDAHGFEEARKLQPLVRI